MNIGIYIYEDAEVLDFSGPFEVFSTAKRMSDNSTIDHVFLVAETRNEVLARGGYKVLPHYGFESHPTVDVLVVVGGVHTKELTKQSVLNWVKQQASTAKLVTSVCTGAFILAEAGVLKNENVTTHWEDIPDLRSNYPNLTVIENKRWVQQGIIITSGGISAGIDMSLHLVSLIEDSDLAEKTAKQMEFSWTKNSDS